MLGTASVRLMSARRGWFLPLVLVLITAAIVTAIATSSLSGTGATDVGSGGGDPPATAPADAAGSGGVSPGDCEPTESNPGGTNSYIPDAPEGEPLGEGLTISGTIREAPSCRPLEGLRIQVWLATEEGGETENRTSVRTGPDGRYEVETAPVVNQFGEPNIHVAYDDEEYGDVFIRRVIDLDDTQAVVDLNLARDG